MRRELIRRSARRLVIALIVMIGAAWASRAEAACTISTSGINFGTYSVFSATPDDATGTVTVDCTNADTNVSVTFSTGSSGTFTARTMKRGADALSYNIFAEASRTTVVGDGTSGSVYYFSSRPGNPAQTITLYGRIPPLQDVSIGSYTDTVLASVNF